MRVLYWQPYLNGLGADHWIYLGWKHGFEDSGHNFLALTAVNDWRKAIDQARPDILFCQNLVDLERHAADLLWAREYGIRVFLVVHWPMSAADVEIIRDHAVADVYFGEREPESMTAFTQATGREYHLIPNAADSRLHFPAPYDPKYAYDIVYLGANLPTKRVLFDAILRPLAQRYRLGLFGPGWTWQDRVVGSLGRAARKLALNGVADLATRARITIPVEAERVLYSSAKICLNFHEQVPGHLIVNQRTFKIAACGGFQICDDAPVIRRYFGVDEVLVAGEPQDWFEQVERYLNLPELRSAMMKRAAKRAHQDHTYVKRVERVMELAASARRPLPASASPVDVPAIASRARA